MRTLTVAVFSMSLAANGVGPDPREPIVGLPCEGCEAVFDGLPENLTSRSRIAPDGEPGEAMTVTGRVYGPDRKPRAGVIVYAYQTDARGVYPPPPRPHGRDSDRHGRLRGWSLSGADGRYSFETIRPASYPSRDVPAHIHMHVVERGCASYYIDDIVFTDDPLLTPDQVRQHARGRGGKAVATPVQENGRWRVTRDIELGARIPGYPACGGV